MNKLDLNAYNVSAMSAVEMREKNGGGWSLLKRFPKAFVGFIIVDIAMNWDSAKEAWNAGRERAHEQHRQI